MTNFFRYRPVLTGFIGGPGINTWHGEESTLGFDDEDPDGFARMVREAYQAMVLYLAPGVRVTFPTEVTWHDEATGELRDVFPCEARADIVASDIGGYAQESRATQIVSRLQTSVVRHGKRLRGRHFIGPASGYALGADGQVTAAARTAVASAYGGLIDPAGPNLVVWGPPIKDDDGAVIAPGKKGLVEAVSVSATPGSLTSRRD